MYSKNYDKDSRIFKILVVFACGKCRVVSQSIDLTVRKTQHIVLGIELLADGSDIRGMNQSIITASAVEEEIQKYHTSRQNRLTKLSHGEHRPQVEVIFLHTFDLERVL